MEEKPMFEGGVRQLLWWAYTLPSISPHDRTWHALMIDKMGDTRNGYLPDHVIRPRINLGQISSSQMYAEAATLHNVVEKNLDHNEKHFVWAKYADPDTPQHGKQRGASAHGLKNIGLNRTARYLVRECRVKRSVEVVYWILVHMYGNASMRQHHPVTQIIQRCQLCADSFYATVDKIEDIHREMDVDIVDSLRSVFRPGLVVK